MKTKLILLAAGIILVTTCNNDIIDGFFQEEAERESENAQVFTVSIAPGIANGSLSAQPTEASAGTAIEISVTGNERYMLKSGSLSIQHAEINEPVSDNKPYTFTMPEADVIVSAEFMLYDTIFIKIEDTSGNIAHSMRRLLDEYIKPHHYTFEFPYGLTDVFTTMDYPYWIGDTEVSFKLWDLVRTWAMDAARGENVYTIPNSGARGGGSSSAASRNTEHPVTGINWYEAVVWCNALTEWYNVIYEDILKPVYQRNGTILRDATDTASLDVVVPLVGATGFCLPSSREWELAARWRKDSTNSVPGLANHANYTSFFTQGKYASGVNSLNGADSGQVGVFSASSTAPVKSKRPNDLGIYDMSGNVAEMCFDKSATDPGSYILKGQAWPDPNLSIGSMGKVTPTQTDGTIGFRVARLE
jgi:hypothetical protein